MLNPTHQSRVRRLCAQILAAAALLIMVYSAGQLVWPKFTGPVERGLWFFALAVLLFGLAIRLARSAPLPIPVFTGETLTPAPLSVSGRVRLAKAVAVALAVAGMLIQIEINAYLLGSMTLAKTSHHVQFLLLCASFVLLVWGLSDRRFTRPRWGILSAMQRWELGFVVAVTTVSFALRFYNLEAVRAFVDEGNFLFPMSRFWRETTVPLLQPMHFGIAFPLIYPYLQSIGDTLAGSGLIGMRLPSALFGSLTIPALYLLAKQLSGRQVAVAASILLATLPVHLQWSRLGMNNVADPFFGVLMLALLVRGVRRGGSWHFAVAGVCFGLTQYFYEAGRLVFPALVVIWFLYLMLLTVWKRVPRRYIGVFLLAAFIVASPIYITLFSMDRSMTTRLDHTRLTGEYLGGNGDLPALLARLPDRIGITLLLLFNRPEGSNYNGIIYYSYDQPLIQVYLLPVLLLGVSALVWRWRTPAGSLLLVWIVGVILAVSFAIQWSNSARLLVMFPALVLVCAMGIVEALRLLLSGHKRLIWAALFFVVCTIGLLDTAYFFGIHTDQFTQRYYRLEYEQEISFRSRDLPAGTEAHFISSIRIRQGALDLFARALNRGVKVWMPTVTEQVEGYIDRIPFDDKQVFYIAEADKASYDALNRRFVLSEPVRWKNLYPAAGIVYVLYRPLADRRALDTE